MVCSFSSSIGIPSLSSKLYADLYGLSAIKAKKAKTKAIEPSQILILLCDRYPSFLLGFDFIIACIALIFYV